MIAMIRLCWSLCAALMLSVCIARAGRAADFVTAEVELAPSTQENEHNGIAQGVFHLQRCILHLESGPMLLSAEQGGSMRTDDAVRIEVEHEDGRRVEWLHDFRDGVTGGIAALPPQRLDALFVSGVNTVTISLIDLRPPARSSSAYVLRYRTNNESPPAQCVDEREMRLRQTLASAPALPVAPDDALRWNVPPAVRALSTSEPSRRIAAATIEGSGPAEGDGQLAAVDEFSERSRLQAKASDHWEPGLAPQPTSESDALPTSGFGIGRSTLVLATVVVALMVMLAYAARRSSPRLSGLLSVQDIQTGERLDHVDLVQYGDRVWIQRAPLRVNAGVAPHGAMASLVAAGDGGCVSCSTLSGRRVLHDGAVVMIGEQVRMHYRAPTTVYVRSGEAAS